MGLKGHCSEKEVLYGFIPNMELGVKLVNCGLRKYFHSNYPHMALPLVPLTHHSYTGFPGFVEASHLKRNDRWLQQCPVCKSFPSHFEHMSLLLFNRNSQCPHLYSFYFNHCSSLHRSLYVSSRCDLPKNTSVIWGSR